jgi:O-antigen/teichoic acid export membrane protein
MPLVTLPLITRALGPEGFGHAAVATAAYFFGTAGVDFGISLPLAARLVTKADDEALLRRRYARLRSAAFGVFITTAVCAYLFDAPYSAKLACLGLLAGGSFFLSETWVLVSRRQFGRLALSEWSGRATNLLVLLTGLAALPSPVWIPVALGAGALVTGATSRLLATKNSVGDGAGALSFKELALLGAPAVAGRFLFTAYGQGASMLYAIVLDSGSLGLYSASDRVVRAAHGLANPVSLAIFPKFADQRAHIRLLASHAKRYTVWSMAVSLLGSVILSALASPISNLLYGSEFSGSANIMRVLSFLLPFAVGAQMLVTNYFNVVGDTKTVFLTTAAGLSSTLLSLFLAYLSGSLLVLAIGSVVAEASAFVVAWTRVARSVRRLVGPGSPLEPTESEAPRAGAIY